MDTFAGFMSDPRSLHKYAYVHGNPINGIDPSGHLTLMEKAVALAVQATLTVLRVAAKVYPGAQVLAGRIASWYFIHEQRILFWSTLSAGAATFLELGTSAILNNSKAITMRDGSVGSFVEQAVGANATQLEIVDDVRDGLATSIKSNSQNMDRALNRLSREALTVANRSSDWNPANTAPPGSSRIPISTTPNRAVFFVIPENHAHFLANRRFVETIRQIQQANRVVISVVPLRGWRR